MNWVTYNIQSLPNVVSGTSPSNSFASNTCGNETNQSYFSNFTFDQKGKPFIAILYDFKFRFDANEHNLIATMFEGLSGNRANYHHGAIESSHQKFIDYSTFVRIQWLPKRTYLIKRDVTW